jgi:hypothetical protein
MSDIFADCEQKGCHLNRFGVFFHVAQDAWFVSITPPASSIGQTFIYNYTATSGMLWYCY